MSFSDHNFYLLLISIIIVSITSLPLFQLKSNPFTIWSWIFYSTILGVLFRSIYLVFELADISILRSIFLRDKEIIDFLYPSIIMLIAFFSLLLGYMACKKRYKIKNLNILKNEWNKSRYVQITLILLIISFTSIYVFVQSNGGLISGIISQARGVSETLEDTNPQGYLRLFSSLGFINLFLTLTWLKTSKKLKFYSRLIFFLSLIGFVFFNFFISQRGTVVFIFIKLIAFSYYIFDSKTSYKRLITFGFTALILFEIMSLFRYNDKFETDDFNFNLIKKFEPAILTINFIDISKTAHIIDGIPKKLPFAFGGTYITSLYAPIPRSIWPTKPVVNVDNIVGQKIYGSRYFGAGGTPAGLIAEAYWNFWLFGILIVPFLTGIFLRYIENTFIHYKRSNNVIILYVTCFMLLGLNFVGSSFSSVVVSFLKMFIPTLFILSYLSKQKKCQKI
jgi:oligosaccharide repeat unit polymerase